MKIKEFHKGGEVQFFYMSKYLLKNIEEIEGKLSYVFKDKELLSTSFTHRSFVNENKHLTSFHNERLEFLGDAILELLISDYLFTRNPESKEGDLSALRSQLVDASSCCLFIQHLDVGQYLLLGKGETMNEGKGRETIYADLFEAILGAVYLDGGIQTAQEFFFKHFEGLLNEMLSNPSRNWKAMLQDYIQKKYQKQPSYIVDREEGPDHEKTFFVNVVLNNEVLGSGTGLSKKEAEQSAAEHAYKQLNLGEDLG